MNRRLFLGGAFALIGASAVKMASTPALADTALLPETPASACLFPPDLLDRTEILIHDIRSLLNDHNLLAVPTDLADFYNSVADQYERTFAAPDINWDELDEAAHILNDPACFVAEPPLEGCEYYEAWKFFRHQEGLALYPADGSVPFRSLLPDDQVKVAEATTAYTGMLQGLFSSLMERYGLIDDKFNTLLSELFVNGNELNEIRLSASACYLPPPGYVRPAPVQAIIPQPAVV
jgi:hypothetical protein